MRPASKEPKRRSRPSSPLRDRNPSSPPRSRFSPPRVSLLDDVTEDFATNPRSFPHSVKKQCWEKAEKIKGRDPDRWRRDPLGNTVFRKLVGCPGCLCHDYDHIVPYSKAKVNRSKGNRTEYSRAELIQKSSYCRVSGRDMDLIELSAYGNVRPAREDSYCPVPGRGVDLIDLSAKGNIRNAQEFWGCTIQ
ncbi:uncharacterized protein LOC112175563 isoform X2 [Rosa chinensis]|uniref:uncharacterized protein LOC112175563 isoform X2 n=1 Tax=Rosa chinensis TaxID=74649 RepID=UPI000D094FC5|nr:uncharacterized protein LOC112175563 isoform X2 [Rosa chinensis]